MTRCQVANAEAARGATTPEATDLAAPPEPTIVAQSQGRQWPRAILASTLDEATNTQWLHVMVSDKPDQPFRIASSMPMFGGAELPALGAQLAGAPLLDTGEKNGLAASPADAVEAYAAAIAQPKGKATEVVAADDPFATGLKTAAAAQAKALGKLGTPDPGARPASRGRHHLPPRRRWLGHVRPDGAHRHHRGEAQGKELVLPAEYAKLLGKKKVKKSLTLNNLEPIALVLPKTGKGEVIGASDLLVSGRGR